MTRALLAKIDALSDQERARILDRGNHEDGQYVVTDRLADFAGLPEWLTAADAQKPLSAAGEWQVPKPANPDIDDALADLFKTALLPIPTLATPVTLTNTGEQTLKIPSPAESASVQEKPPAGEFTSLFAAPVLRPASAPAAANPPSGDKPGEFTNLFAAPVLRPAPTPAPSAVNPPSSDKPGEFTNLFASPVLRPAPAPSSSSAPSSDKPGEFTNLFAAPVLRPAPAASTPPSSEKAGEFTKMFQVPQGTPPQQATPPVANKMEPGEFTQMLQSQRPAAPLPAPTPAQPQSTEFSKFFQSPMASPSQGSPMGNLAPPTPPQPPRGSSEFTKIFGRGDGPAAPPPPAPAAPPHTSSGATQAFAAPVHPAHPPSPAPSPATSPVTSPFTSPFANLTGPRSAPKPPGEYTRMFSTPAQITFGQPQSHVPQFPQTPRAPEPMQTKRNSSLLPMLLVGGALLLLIAAILLYFMMKPRSG
jgi:hypothetical protein